MSWWADRQAEWSSWWDGLQRRAVDAYNAVVDDDSEGILETAQATWDSLQRTWAHQARLGEIAQVPSLDEGDREVILANQADIRKNLLNVVAAMELNPQDVFGAAYSGANYGILPVLAAGALAVAVLYETHRVVTVWEEQSKLEVFKAEETAQASREGRVVDFKEPKDESVIDKAADAAGSAFGLFAAVALFGGGVYLWSKR